VLWTTTGDGFFDDPTAINAVYYLGLDDIWRGDVQLCIEVQDAGSCQFTASDCMMIHIPQQLIYFDADTWWGLSSYLNPDVLSIPEVMSQMELTPGSQHLVTMLNEQGQYYWPELTPPTNNIGNWAPIGYKIKTKNSPACLPIYGDTLADQTFVVDGSYTFLPVLTNVPVSIDDLFGAHVNDILLIFDWSAGNLWTPVASDFDELMPGRAYLLVNRNSGNSFTIEYPDFDPAAPHLYPESKDNFAVNNSPWSDVKNTSNPHVLLFDNESLFELQAGDIIGAFGNEGVCYGMKEYEGPGSFFRLVANGNNPFSKNTDGFVENELMRFQLFRQSSGETMEVTFTLDKSYPNYDGLFAVNGVSMVKDISMEVTSVNDMFSIHSVNIFPNPARGLVNLASDLDMRGVTILNHAGQKILERKIVGRACQIDISMFATGMYFVQIETADGNIFTKRTIFE
jgi:hypothetical protein